VFAYVVGRQLIEPGPHLLGIEGSRTRPSPRGLSNERPFFRREGRMTG
jgi:hypothetical protein